MASGGRPVGDVTFLFTDIEGSTRLVESLGTAAWRPVLARHRELIRTALAAHDGIEILTEGDGFFAVFTSPASATAGVVEAQRALAAEPWPEGATVRVRMGLHAGEGELDADGSYVGHDVHRAARIAAAGHGGQVLVSEATATRLDGDLPAGVTLRPLGAHRLKDLRPELLSQLVIEGLPADFPPIRSLEARPNNLPTELTTFVGRERELAEVRDLLGSSRLVTLTGPGGTGKTRLALQVAAVMADDVPDGTWYVPLGAVSDPELVVPAIARAVGVAEDPARPPIDVLADELGPKRALLVLDNLEQVRAAAGDVAELLRRAQHVRILATSRAPLRVTGEQEYPVPGLPAPVDLDRLGPYERERLPDALRSHDPEVLLGFEAVRLFVARGSAVRPGFALTAANAGDVAAIVAHLGGVPLAIELAAARLRFLTPGAIHERLEGRLDLPGAAAGAADVPERQRSLRAAIMWSHELLDPPARRLFERLGVFVGGFDLGGAEAVAGPGADVANDAGDVLEGLASLVDQSLVRSDELAGEPRFAMLEPIREYALERLEASGDADATRERHARAVLALAQALQPQLAGERQREALDRLELEHANARAALDWADAHADAPLALGITFAVWRFWQKRGYLREARMRVAALLTRPWFATAPPELQARTHEVMGGIIYWHGEVAQARPDYEAALATWRALGDRAEIANALYNLSFCSTMNILQGAQGDPVLADALLREAYDLYQELGDERGMANVEWGRGIQHYFARDNGPAAEAFEAALVLYRRVGDRTQEAWSLHQLGSAKLKLGEVQLARDLLRDCLRLFDAAGDVAGVTLALNDLSAVATAEDELPRAARLQGLSRRMETSSGTGLAGQVENEFETGDRPSVGDRLPPDDLARYRAEGAAMPLEDGVRYALGEVEWRGPEAPSPASPAEPVA